VLDFIKKLFGVNSSFDTTFSYLKEVPKSMDEQAAKVYGSLKRLSKNSTETEGDKLISEFQKLRVASNTNSVFFFYFPIVSHILYFKPSYGNTVLHHLIGPLFANGNGDEKPSEMIRKIQNSMDFKLKENPTFLTKEGQLWVKNILPTMKAEIQQEIDICKKELEG